MTSDDRRELDEIVMTDRCCGLCGTPDDLEPLVDSSGWTCRACRAKALANGQAALDFLRRRKGS